MTDDMRTRIDAYVDGLLDDAATAALLRDVDADAEALAYLGEQLQQQALLVDLMREPSAARPLARRKLFAAAAIAAVIVAAVGLWAMLPRNATQSPLALPASTTSAPSRVESEPTALAAVRTAVPPPPTAEPTPASNAPRELYVADVTDIPSEWQLTGMKVTPSHARRDGERVPALRLRPTDGKQGRIAIPLDELSNSFAMEFDISPQASSCSFNAIVGGVRTRQYELGHKPKQRFTSTYSEILKPGKTYRIRAVYTFSHESDGPPTLIARQYLDGKLAMSAETQALLVNVLLLRVSYADLNLLSFRVIDLNSPPLPTTTQP